MEYPVRFPNNVDTDGNELSLFSPSQVVLEASALLPLKSKILDYGAGYGYNSIFLADKGHEVFAVDINEGYIRDRKVILGYIGGTALKNLFHIKGDLRAPMLRPVFDAVISTRSLQFVEKQEASHTIENLQKLTKPGGLNIIQAYIGTPDQQREKAKYNLYEPGEIVDLYNGAGWNILSNQEELNPLSRGIDSDSKPISLVSSTTTVIAKRPLPIIRTQRFKGMDPEYWRRTDPELYEHMLSSGQL